jgi:hypothetical protein
VRGFILAAVRRNCLSQNHKVLNTFAFKSILKSFGRFPAGQALRCNLFSCLKKDFHCNP